MEATITLDNGTAVKAVLWQKQGKCRIYITTIVRGRETGAGSFERINGKWNNNGVSKDLCRQAWGSWQGLIGALGFENGQPPRPTLGGSGRKWERIDLDAEPGEPGHICG